MEGGSFLVFFWVFFGFFGFFWVFLEGGCGGVRRKRGGVGEFFGVLLGGGFGLGGSVLYTWDLLAFFLKKETRKKIIKIRITLLLWLWQPLNFQSR